MLFRSRTMGHYPNSEISIISIIDWSRGYQNHVQLVYACPSLALLIKWLLDVNIEQHKQEDDNDDQKAFVNRVRRFIWTLWRFLSHPGTLVDQKPKFKLATEILRLLCSQSWLWLTRDGHSNIEPHLPLSAPLLLVAI